MRGGSLTNRPEKAMPLPLWWALPQVPGFVEKTLPREEHPFLSLSLPSFPGGW